MSFIGRLRAGTVIATGTTRAKFDLSAKRSPRWRRPTQTPHPLSSRMCPRHLRSPCRKSALALTALDYSRGVRELIAMCGVSL